MNVYIRVKFIGWLCKKKVVKKSGGGGFAMRVIFALLP